MGLTACFCERRAITPNCFSGGLKILRFTETGVILRLRVHTLLDLQHGNYESVTDGSEVEETLPLLTL